MELGTLGAGVDGRRRRDGRVATAIAIGAAGTALGVVIDLLFLAARLQDADVSAWRVASAALLVAGDAALAAGLVLAAAAIFAGDLDRARRLARAATVAVVGLSVAAVAQGGWTVVDTIDGLSARGVAAGVAGSLAEAALVGVAAMAAIAFRSDPAGGAAMRDRRLAWAVGCYAGAALFLAAGAALLAGLYDDFEAKGSLVSGTWILGGGMGVQAVAAVVAVLAFLGSARRRPGGDPAWRPARDGRLARAAGALAIGFLAQAIGVALLARSLGANGYGGADAAGGWLGVPYALVLTVAMAVLASALKPVRGAIAAAPGS